MAEEDERQESAVRSEAAKEAWRKRREREAAEAASTRQGSADFDPAGNVAGEKVPDVPKGAQVRVIHFIEDGLTSMGKIFYRGQELSVAEGTAEWDMTVDRNGDSWLDEDETTQIRKHGKVMFRQGPWPHKNEGLMTEEEYLKALHDSDAEAIKKYEKQRMRSSKPPGVKVPK